MGERILVVDDDELIGRVIQRGLGNKGFEVDVAASPSEGISLHAARPYPLAILDVNLPEMSGPALAAALKQVSEISVVLISGDLGVVHYELAGVAELAKPFTMAALEALVARLV